MRGHWRITLGNGDVYHERDWYALHMDERRRLLVAHPGSRTEFMPAAVAIECPACHKPGEIDEQDGKLLLSEGFVFDAIKVPVCEVCGVPAGVRLGECKAMLDTFGDP